MAVQTAVRPNLTVLPDAQLFRLKRPRSFPFVMIFGSVAQKAQLYHCRIIFTFFLCVCVCLQNPITFLFLPPLYLFYSYLQCVLSVLPSGPSWCKPKVHVTTTNEKTFFSFKYVFLYVFPSAISSGRSELPSGSASVFLC